MNTNGERKKERTENFKEKEIKRGVKNINQERKKEINT